MNSFAVQTNTCCFYNRCIAYKY